MSLPVAYEKSLDTIPRVLAALLFVVSGLAKTDSPEVTQGYMRDHGVSAALLWPAILLEVLGGALLLMGLWSRVVAFLLAAFCILTAIIFHRVMSDQFQIMMFLKNVALAGNLLVIVRKGPTGFSVDDLRQHTGPV